MLQRAKGFLLPIAGALSAVISFFVAAPFVKSLHRPWLKPEDPVAHFTIGTTWTYVQHAVFGLLLAGSFCFLLEVGRRTPKQLLKATLIGMVLGAITNSIADSAADMVGIAAMRALGSAGQFAGELAWITFVPASLAFTIAISIGLTKQRVYRAIFATFVAAIFCAVGRVIGSVIGAVIMMAKMAGSKSDLMSMATNQSSIMEHSIPAWMTVAIFAGISLGLTMAISDRVSRKASLRLVYGRNEYRDWSLDHAANRIGSGEVEIPVRGFAGVQPVHSCIFRQGNLFIFDSQHAPATVNGYPAAQAPLNNGDTIQVGDAVLVFSLGNAKRSAPTYTFPNGLPMQVPMPAAAMPVAPVTDIPVSVILLECLFVDSFGRQFPLQGGINTVGREQGNQVCIANESTVSRSHAQVLVEAGGVTLTDLGSANGTRVNGVGVTSPIQLKTGDAVAFGKATMSFRILNS